MEPTGLNILLSVWIVWGIGVVINKLTEKYGDELPPTWPFY